MLNLNQSSIDKFRLPETTMLVILNGVYQPQLSNPTESSSFKDSILTIPKNTKINLPIHLLFLTTKNCKNSLKIIAEENSYTTIIEEYASLLKDKQYHHKIVTHITAKTNSEIVHYKLQFENTEQSTHNNQINIVQALGSKITRNFISKGAKLFKEHLHIKLDGENASVNIKGINLLNEHQDMGHQIQIEHLKPNCTSHVLSKSIVDDQANNNFACRVIAHSSAAKTETHVTNKNLLLAEGAIANASPELEVYVDDVICTHGATVGQLDADALFYLRSRGIAKSMAIKILIAAFVQEITDQFAKYDRFKLTAGLI